MMAKVGMYYRDGDVDYISRRLTNTVVLDGRAKPVFVHGIYRGEGPKDVIAHVEPLGGGQVADVNLNTLDLEPPRLGYYNVETTAHFVCRKPVRGIWRQGLCPQQLVFTTGLVRNFYIFHLKNTIENNFPSYEQSLKNIENGFYRSAFSRDFALWAAGKDVHLYYHQHQVGLIERGVAVLAPKFFFLSEHLQQDRRG